MVVGARRSAGLSIDQTADPLGFSHWHNRLPGLRDNGPKKRERKKCLVDVMRMSQVRMVRLVEEVERQLALKQPLLPTKVCTVSSLNPERLRP